jgi:hypothetical protein
MFSTRVSNGPHRTDTASSGSHQHTEASRTPPESFTKPKGIHNAHLQSLLKWESEQYGAIQVINDVQSSISTTIMTLQAFIHECMNYEFVK